MVAAATGTGAWQRAGAGARKKYRGLVPVSLVRLDAERTLQRGKDELILKADLAGLRANYLLTSRRTPNPFQMAQWRTFRLPEQL